MKTVVISANDNDEYLFFVPIVSWAWRSLGWNVHCCFTGDKESDKFKFVKENSKDVVFSYPENIEGVRNETLTQLSRLYAYKNIESGYIMTSDVDMLPLSDYWKFDISKITAWGRDLSDVHYPICYVGAEKYLWNNIMCGGDMLSDLQTSKYASDKWSEWWQIDQDILTEKLNKQNVTRIDRGIAPNTHYPLGRIDRGSWDKTKDQSLRIDAHLLRPGYTNENWIKIIHLIDECFNVDADVLIKINKYKNQYLTFL